MKRLLLLFLLVGCDSVTRVENIGEPVREERSVSCTYTGYCYACGPGFDGNMNCGLKMTAFCSGNQKAIVEIQRQRYFYESGDIRDITSMTTIKELETCN